MSRKPDESSPERLPLRFNLRELAGSFGDLGTFLPLTVALAATTGLNFGWMLVAAGLMNIATGLLFRLPVPVQPMKAIAAVAIAEGLSGGAVIAAGWIMGIVLTLIAVTGLIPLLDRLVPRPVVRAIQLGIGIKLILHAIDWLGILPVLGINSVMVALFIGGLLLVGTIRNWPIVLLIFAAGFAIIAIETPTAYQTLTINPPTFDWITPTTEQWRDGLFHGALPQIPLTLLNSVIAVCALSGDYFRKQRISPKRMALSVGLMNLLCVGWSGLPMCHGSGGLAAQYRAGARTGGSVIMLGAMKVLLGILLGISLLPLLEAYPAAVLAPLIGFAGLSLGHAGCMANKKTDWITVAPTAIMIGFTNILYGLLFGLFLYAITMWIRSKSKSIEN